VPQGVNWWEGISSADRFDAAALADAFARWARASYPVDTLLTSDDVKTLYTAMPVVWVPYRHFACALAKLLRRRRVWGYHGDPSVTVYIVEADETSVVAMERKRA